MTAVGGIRARPVVSSHSCASELNEGVTQLVLIGFVCDSVVL